MEKIVRTVRIEETVQYRDLLKDFRTILHEEKTQPPTHDLGRLLTLSETAAFFKISKRSLFNWCQNGIIKKVQVGNRVYFRKEDIEDLIEKNRGH